ncbi:MAG: SirA family protein [Actinobacteria bacterium]|jgi:TusA-related sulfurtransferase|nr:SirA family protein [Actinomycetota bacterium]|tara:strand:+ start:52 stop:288 length:237 start_codon:yes stop_codon:yes gene_type:complete
MSKNKTESKQVDVRGEICPYPMMLTNKELDNNPQISEFEIFTDHPPALSTIPPEAMKRGFECEIEASGPGEWTIRLTK